MMMTRDLERAIVQCKKFFVSPRHGRVVYEYADLLDVMKSNGVDVSKITNRIMGRMIGGFGGFVLHQSKIGDRTVSTVQASPDRIEALKKQVALYVDKPTKGPSNGVRFCGSGFGTRRQRKAKF